MGKLILSEEEKKDLKLPHTKILMSYLKLGLKNSLFKFA